MSRSSPTTAALAVIAVLAVVMALALPADADTGQPSSGFFGLSPTAAIIVSVAVLLVVVLAIVAMTNSRDPVYDERDRSSQDRPRPAQRR